MMDYTDILKRAWHVTWSHKTLWVLGFFAGAAGGGFGGGNSGYRTGSTSPATGQQFAAFQQTLMQYLGLIVVSLVVLFVIGLVWWIFSIAARGGLVYLVNESQEGRTVRAGDGWGVGFRKWWRVFGIEFLAGLPVLLLVIAVAIVIGGSVASVVGSGGSQAEIGRALAGVALGGVCLILVFAIVAILLGIVLGIVAQLAVRYAVLSDMRVIESLKQGWSDLWSRRGAGIMFLIQFGVGIAYGIVTGIVAAIIAVPAALAFMGRAWGIGALLTLLTIAILIVPSAVYGTFYSSVWTIFFRRMTGMEPAAPVTVPAYSPPSPYPPAPPAPYAPPSYQPAPPAPPAPEVPAPPAPPAPEVPAPPAPPAPEVPAPPAPPAPQAPEFPAPPTPPVPPAPSDG